jgi:nucleotide-binding universal stress UspA family protein
MIAIDPVLAAVDFSDDARRAASRAAFLAAEQGARLDLLHVLSNASAASLVDLLRPHAGAQAQVLGGVRAMLEELASELARHAGVTANPRVEQGEVLPTILAAAREAGLLVVGAHGWNPLRDLILGSTAERLLGRCRRPVLVVRRPARGPYRRVVAATDFSPHSLAALAVAMRIAPGADIVLVHAFGIPFEGKLRIAGVDEERLREYRAQARQQALADMLSTVATIEGDRGRLSHAVAHGHPPQLILAKARQLRADLVVIGKKGRTAAEDFLLGSVTRHVLSDAKCDVLVVQEPAGRP